MNMPAHMAHNVRPFESTTMIGEALRWALPRLAVYAAAAIASAILFVLWGAFYTYVWPRVVPAPISAPEQFIQMPSPTPIVGPLPAKPEVKEELIAGTFPPLSAMSGAPVLGDKNEVIGMIVSTQLATEASGKTTRHVFVKLKDGKDISLPADTIKWTWDSTNPQKLAVGRVSPEEMARHPG